MLFNAHVPATYWVDAFSSATYIINHLPTPILDHKSPFDLLFSQVPIYNNFRTYGCLVFPYLQDYVEHKLAPRSVLRVFIGYSSQYKGYRCLGLTTSLIYITRHARFDENSFPFSGLVSSTEYSKMVLTSFLDKPGLSKFTSHMHFGHSTFPANAPHVSMTKPCLDCVDQMPSGPLYPISAINLPSHTADQPVNVGSTPEQIPVMSQQVPLPSTSSTQPSTSTSQPSTSPVDDSNTHPMITRAKAEIFKPRHQANLVHTQTHSLYLALFTEHEPKGFKSASKDPKWLLAMHGEMQALHQNGTWTLVPRPHDVNVIGSKWIFRTKFNYDGTVERYKAHLVAQGFTQIHGLNYSHTFNTVVKASIVCVFLSLVVINNWKLHQLDVKNMFLHGHLSESVYMEQPPRLILNFQSMFVV